MSDAKVRGIVHYIDETKSYGKNGFRKRLVVIEQDKDRFTNYVPCEFMHEGCDSVDELKIGDDIEITYRLSGRKWQRDPQSEVKYFLNAEATSFKKMNGAPAKGGSSAPNIDAANQALDEAAYDENDIPF
ncbi:MAG: DUF3127 domain-containing protein [Planctomycetales bacterium]|nr:DUF3127 domain-containing protein [Planctomycetales bacterium]